MNIWVYTYFSILTVYCIPKYYIVYGIEVELHETIVLLRVHDCTAMFVNNFVQQLVQKQHSCYDLYSDWSVLPPFVWRSLMSIVCGFGSSNIVTAELTIPNTFVSHCMQPLYLIRHDLKPPLPAIYPQASENTLYGRVWGTSYLYWVHANAQC